MSTPAFSIVVVTWECEPYLRALIASLNRELSGGEQLIVVDNGSSDDPEAATREWTGEAEFVRLGSNPGFGAAANAGVALARTPATVILNPDTEVLDGSLAALASAALELGAIVGPRVLNPDGTVQPSASGPEVGIWPWARAILPGALTPRPLLRITEPYRLERRTRVTWLTGACIAGPTALMRRLGPFDASLRLFGEDTDLGLRAAAVGVPSWFCPRTCRIVHHGQGSSTLAYGTRDGWRPDGTLNWRAALRRAYGPARERRAWLALRFNLRLRIAAKWALRRDRLADRAALRAARAATPVPALRPAPTTVPERASTVRS